MRLLPRVLLLLSQADRRIRAEVTAVQGPVAASALPSERPKSGHDAAPDAHPDGLEEDEDD